MAELLDIVNEYDAVIGQVPRDEVHEKGLTCRMVYVWFYTPDKKLILQRRSKTKKSHPGRLTAAVSGHVESGQTYVEAAVKEMREETGLQVSPDALKSAGVVHARYHDEADTNYISDGMRASFLYRFIGDASSLAVEEGEGSGFELWDIDAFLLHDPTEFVPFISSVHGRAVLEKIRSL